MSNELALANAIASVEMEGLHLCDEGTTCLINKFGITDEKTQSRIGPKGVQTVKHE